MRPRSSRSAFTLIEMLAVITIIGILTVILVPVGGGILRSYQINTGSQTVLGQLNMGRQAAQTRGHAVQVRFYYLPDANDAVTASPSVYRGMQCFVEGEPTTAGTPLTALTKPFLFNAPVIVLNDTTHSTLLTLTQSTPASTEPLGQYKVNYKFVSFRFKPTGKTDLPDTATGLTLVLKGDKIAANGVPSNFRSIEIDPRNGVIRKYAP